jgi:uroporphyrinogen decarboxylase
MTHKERFIAALERRPVEGRVPHFELVFFLTMEVLGKVHPSHRFYEQWGQMSADEKRLHIDDMAFCFTAIAEKYEHDAIFVHPNPNTVDVAERLIYRIRETAGDRYFIMMHGDCTFGMPNGDSMMDFTVDMYEHPKKLLRLARKNLEAAAAKAEELKRRGAGPDAFALCSDYCFNVNPFFSSEQFGTFVAPYLAEIIGRYRDMGYYSIKHTDGNIMPILGQMLDCKPDALHSLDPQGGVSLAEMKRLAGRRLCLIGNVNCGLLQTGSDEDIDRDVRRALRDGMPGYGYIFSTSNCVYTGLRLDRYERMHDIWMREGIYGPDGAQAPPA